jgi:transcriptional regulator with XRE-family HTH domain
MRRQRAERADQYRSRTYRLLLGSLAANVRALRKMNGWTQEDAAEKCGMAVPVYQRIEAAGVNLTFTTLARLCNGFQVEAQRLVRLRKAPTRQPPGRPKTLKVAT